jgi:hypothetical protein
MKDKIIDILISAVCILAVGFILRYIIIGDKIWALIK